MTGIGRPRPTHYEVGVRDGDAGPVAAAWTPATVHRADAGSTPLRFASLGTARDYADRHAARGPRIVLVDEGGDGGREVAG